MRSVFELYSSFWPQSRHEDLKEILKNVYVLYYPEDQQSILAKYRTHSTIIIIKAGGLPEILRIMRLGYDHCIQEKRADFAQELLASAMMVVRPAAFKKNPIPFFFTGFLEPSATKFVETYMTSPLRKTSDKEYVLDRLRIFLSQNERLSGISDICDQVADELMSNALFSAPVSDNGHRMYQQSSRMSDAISLEGKEPVFFAGFSDYRVVIGCEDKYGSFGKTDLLRHLDSVFSEQHVAPRSGDGGAGLGFKYIIESASNFYIFSDPGVRSLVACCFLLKGMKANLDAQKHIHISIPQK